MIDEQEPQRESPVQTRLRLHLARLGWLMFRNNRGAGKISLPGGLSRFIRWGLANDSKKLGDAIKSGDLVGGRPVLITQEMVGKVILQFASVECKKEGWRPDGSLEYCAQVQWAKLLQDHGGFAIITNNAAEIDHADLIGFRPIDAAGKLTLG